MSNPDEATGPGPDVVRVTDSGGVRTIALARPPVNAISPDLLARLDEVLVDAETTPSVRAVLLASAVPTFCAGFDFGLDPAEVGGMMEVYDRSHRRLLALAKPTVALVQGHAIAGGLVLALACDHMVVADGDHHIGLTEVAVGAGFPVSALEICRLRLGDRAARSLLLDPGVRPVGDLVALGVVDRLHSPDSAAAAAHELAERLGALSAASYAHTKAGLVAPALQAIDVQTPEEAEAAAAAWTHPESVAARRAVRERLGR